MTFNILQPFTHLQRWEPELVGLVRLGSRTHMVSMGAYSEKQDKSSKSFRAFTDQPWFSSRCVHSSHFFYRSCLTDEDSSWLGFATCAPQVPQGWCCGLEANLYSELIQSLKSLIFGHRQFGERAMHICSETNGPQCLDVFLAISVLQPCSLRVWLEAAGWFKALNMEKVVSCQVC